MRSHHVAFVVVQALWATSVVAAPSPAALLQQPLTTTTGSPRSRWRDLSDRVIETIWPPVKAEEVKPDLGVKQPETRLPPKNFAQYGGDIVLRFNISTEEEVKSMADAADTLLLDIWAFSKYWVDIRLAKDLVPSLLGLLQASLQRSHTPLILERDLVQAIYETYPRPRDQRSSQSAAPPAQSQARPFSLSLQPVSNGAETNIFFSDYQPLSVIHPWLRLLSSLFTTHVRPIKIGTSYQGRDISALRVGVHPTNSEDPKPRKRKTVVIMGGLHAREWISTTTVNYVAYSLVTAYGKDPRITKMLEDFDFVFIPTLNPDGYVYTWETDRLWRKNRQQTSVSFCPGIDLDRGFGYQWDGASKAGNPCSESFAGEGAFQAAEAMQFAEWARNETEHNNVDFVGFLDLHSYSQEILYPYSYTCEAAAPGRENLEELALGMEKAIRVSSGQIYEVMAACEGNVGSLVNMIPRVEDAGGSALDWFYHEMRVHFAYQLKLRDRGTYGFLLPRENIVPTGNEIWQAVQYFAGFLSDAYGVGMERTVVSMTKPDFSAEEEDDGVEDPAEEMGSVEPTQDEDFPSSDDDDDLLTVEIEDEEEWVWIGDDVPNLPEWELRRRRR